MIKIFSLCFCSLFVAFVYAQDIKNNPGSNHGNRFEQLGTILPTPNEYRTASGAPGPKYWQQRADYDIVCKLDEMEKTLTGKEKISYFNNSPDVLTYLWLQLDENEHSSINNSGYQTSNPLQKSITEADIAKLTTGKLDKEYGHNITKVTSAIGVPLKYSINKTMMRVEMPIPLKPGQQFIFNIDWNYNIIERTKYGGRGGYENFADNNNDIFTMTQWFPRLCVYSDNQGWQNHQFVGSGEFTLTFGNYKVAITVPADHVVMATGECQNYTAVLTPAQNTRWLQAQTAKEPLEIVTLAEAKEREVKKSTQTKTWVFKADMVRDFAWGSSRKFVWDAMPTYVEGKKIMCMSGYAKEAYSLYKKFSTRAVAHTIKTYSKFTIPYPYPVAQSLEAANGMEYPMICFNYGRTEKDGTYSESTKNGMLGVVIHEVGHNFFPMIINSDERQWSWMDEGLNTFVQYLTEELWDNKYASARGPAYKIVDYMKLPKDQLEPIMTNSENIIQFGPNAYSKPCTGLNILRETIMGRENFDYAFKEYARRWAFKHPTPADLFRTLEDASAEDLDWFWRGWFYNTDPCDISLDSVRWANLSTEAMSLPTRTNATTTTQPVGKPILNSFDDVSKIRNRADKTIIFETDRDVNARDFYWSYARGIAKVDETPFTILLPPQVIDTFTTAQKEQIVNGQTMYELTFSNKGGLVMPIIIEWIFEDGTKEVDRIGVNVWRKNENKVVKTFMKTKKVASIKLDPMLETADINTKNNTWNIVEEPTKFQLFKTRIGGGRGASSGAGNPMQKEIK